MRAAVQNELKMRHYIYDASGERTLKASSNYTQVYENGQPTNGGVTMISYTTYPSPYITISNAAVYTKHYFAGTQRVASRPIGSASIFNSSFSTQFDELKLKQMGDAQAVADSLELGQIEMDEEDLDPTPLPPAVYYFHPDHLGSSTVITDGVGFAYQIFLNLPFGETMAEQRRNGTFDNKFKFNGKELDTETGLYYYGARYYDPRVSIWLSVDPLTEQTMTPYQYTYQNPINLIDPTGMIAQKGDGWGKKTGEDGKSTWEYSNHITKDNYKELGFSEYMDSGNVFSTTNGVADGRYNYSLNADGTVQNSQGSSMGSKFKTGAGTTISNLDKDNSMVGFARRAYMSGNHDPAYSPYTPDAMSVNIGASGNWYVANYDVSLSLIFSPGNISIGGNAGGGLGIDSDMPFKNISPFSLYGSVGFHDTYGDETNVIDGLRRWSTTTTYSGGPFSISRSTSANLVGPNALLPTATGGTKSTYVGYAPRSANIGVNGFASYSKIWSLKNN